MKEVRMFLQQEISAVYPEREASSLTQIILEHFGFPSPVYLLDPQRIPGAETVAQINKIVHEIHTHRPIQYILGYTTFFGIKLFVSEKVLIPRPETEELIYKIIESREGPPSSILDLGTGSGCIALALKKCYPSARVTGLDFSTAALEIARTNGAASSLEPEWIHGDILDPNTLKDQGSYDLIVSNPPYVLDREKSLMDRNVLDFEPPEALFVKNSEPLIYYHAIAALAAVSLSQNGELWVEINEHFGKETIQVLNGAGFSNNSLHKDIHEKERFIRASR